MAIRKKVEKSQADINVFINKGGHVLSDKKAKGNFTNVLLRIPTSFLSLVDEHVEKKPWMTRNQWLMEAIADKLQRIES